MNQKIRLGPVAVFLTIIAAVLATLAMLTVATSRADAALAERFAKVTSIRYALEADGSRFLQEVDAGLQNGGTVPADAERLDDGSLRYTAEQEGYQLTVEVRPDPAQSTYAVTKWKVTKLWEGADPFEDLWLG